MKLTKITIDNFKSIWHLELDIKKYGQSYTTMFLWINESWKTNILEAISLFKDTWKTYDYQEYHNQNNDNSEDITIKFSMEFDTQNEYLWFIRGYVKEWEDLLDIKIKNIEKEVLLRPGNNQFSRLYLYSLEISSNIKINNIAETKEFKDKQINMLKIEDMSEDERYENDANECHEQLDNIINTIIEDKEPIVSIRKPTDNFLITDVDLNSFKEDINSNIPLKHIFAVAWYSTQDEIKNQLNLATKDEQRKKLMKKLWTNITNYVKSIWKHNIKFDIEITDTMKCKISIQDEWKDNENNFYKISARSDWFKHFISLILSLSIETKELWKNNKIILIDEPEIHLHPSWIRDLREELLKIWEKNYVFIATHSPFLIDKISKERNIIVEKNKKSLTEKVEIKNEWDILDDEVLASAFGLNVFKDLLNPYRILVEWACDKVIISKLLKIYNKSYGIISWNWSNINSIATLLNRDDIKSLIIVDDDEDGRKYKEKILKIQWIYNCENVLTIKDIIKWEKDYATIEDILDIDYVESSIKKFIQWHYKKEISIKLDWNKAFLPQIEKYLNQNWTQNLDEDINVLKQELSEKFQPNKTSIENNQFQKLLIEKIIDILEKNNI